MIDNPVGDMNISHLSIENQKTIYFDLFSPERISRYTSSKKKKYDVVFLGQGDSYRNYRSEYIEFRKRNMKKQEIKGR